MNALNRTLDLMSCFKKLIEEKNVVEGMIQRMLVQSTIRENKLKAVEEEKNQEEMFALFHDEVASAEHAIDICQFELLV